MTEHASLEEASKSCSKFSEESSVFARCTECGMAVVLHCDKCEVAVTGCLCTESERYGHELARQRLLARGISLPPSSGA